MTVPLDADASRGRILDEDIASVRERVHIEDVVGDYVTLKPGGVGSQKGLCPFHDEKSPSFHVRPQLGLWHCLAGETRVLTREGLVEIRELAGRTVEVLTSGSKWVTAPFYNFGVQPLLKLTLSRNGHEKIIHATAEHRWFVRPGIGTSQMERTTEALQAGDRLASSFPRRLTLDGPRARLARIARMKRYPRSDWVVKSVEPTQRVEDVFCAVVEGTHSFTLDGNILTGNCFGCSEGGDAISFIQKIDGLTFVEAVEHLANKAGITLRYEEGTGGHRRGEDPQRRQRLIAAHVVAAEYFQAQLMTPEAVTARKFLAARGFDRDAAEQFGLGYSPQGWNNLLRHLHSKGFKDGELANTGLLSEGARGSYDRFRGRLMWPIRDVTGATIGFGARKLFDEDTGPKYLNTPETPLYRKSQVLYGVDLAKRAIAKEHQVVVVEGYTDVMAMHLSGVGTAVATCGTAFGSDHARVVRRLMGDGANTATLSAGSSGEVIFTFDGDSAGQKAALRAFGEDQRFSAQTYVAVADDGMDPCEVRIHRGAEAVRDLLVGRRPLFEFVIQQVLKSHDLATAEGRVRALRASAPVVASIRDAALRPEYARLLSSWTGLDMETVRLAVRSAEANPRPEALGLGGRRTPATEDTKSDVSERRYPTPDLQSPSARVEKAALEVALQQPELARDLGFDEASQASFDEPAYLAVFDAVNRCGGVKAAVAVDVHQEQQVLSGWVERVLEAVPEELRPLVTQLAVAEMPEDRDDALASYVGGVIASLEEARLGRLIVNSRIRLQQMSLDDPEYMTAFASLVDLEAKRRELHSGR